MANTPKIGLKIPSTADNIAEQINIDTPNNLGIIDTEIDGVKTLINSFAPHPTKLVTDAGGVHGLKMKTADFTSNLVNGWVVTGNYNLRFKRIGNMVFVNGYIKDGALAKNTIILTIPDIDFIPQTLRVGEAYQVDNPQIVRSINVFSDGTVKVDNNYAWVAGIYKLNFFYEL